MGRETTRTSDRVRPSRRTRLFLLGVLAALLAIAPAAAQTRIAHLDRRHADAKRHLQNGGESFSSCRYQLPVEREVSTVMRVSGPSQCTAMRLCLAKSAPGRPSRVKAPVPAGSAVRMWSRWYSWAIHRRLNPIKKVARMITCLDPDALAPTPIREAAPVPLWPTESVQHQPTITKRDSCVRGRIVASWMDVRSIRRTGIAEASPFQVSAPSTSLHGRCCACYQAFDRNASLAKISDREFDLCGNRVTLVDPCPRYW